MEPAHKLVVVGDRVGVSVNTCRFFLKKKFILRSVKAAKRGNVCQYFGQLK